MYVTNMPTESRPAIHQSVLAYSNSASVILHQVD